MDNGHVEGAGRQLYESVRKLSYPSALALARCAQSVEERNFFAFVADMNLQRTQWEHIRNEEPKLYQQPNE